MDIAEVEVFTKMLKSSNIKETDTLEIKVIMNMMKRVQIDEVHKGKITPPKDSKGRWMTWAQREGEKRKKKTARTENKLYEILYNFYFVEAIPTITQLYPKFLDFQSFIGINDQTIIKYEQHWEKFFKEQPLVQRKVNTISKYDIEDMFYHIIDTHEVSAKLLNTIKVIIKGSLEVGVRERSIIINPYDLVKVSSKKCKRVKPKKAAERILFKEEKQKLFTQLNTEIIERPDNMHPYLVALLFKLGLRIGEVCALKEADVDFFNQEIRIQRMDSRGKGEMKKTRMIIVEHTKGESEDRILKLDDYTMNMLKSVLATNKKQRAKSGGFIFVGNKGRISKNALGSMLQKYCQRAGIPNKSSHDIRRTVASNLFNDDRWSLEEIRDFLGHKDIMTTKGYIYNIRNDEEKRQRAQMSLQDNNVFEFGSDANRAVPKITHFDNVIEFPKAAL